MKKYKLVLTDRKEVLRVHLGKNQIDDQYIIVTEPERLLPRFIAYWGMISEVRIYQPTDFMDKWALVRAARSIADQVQHISNKPACRFIARDSGFYGISEILRNLSFQIDQEHFVII